MSKTEIKDYSTRIAQASSGELVVITHQIILDCINEARYEKEQDNKVAFIKKIKKGQKALRSLTDSLNVEYNISKELMALYIYVNKEFVEAYVKYTVQPLISIEKVINNLLVGWEKACKAEKSEPLVDNAQQVYAGLTYGKGTLNETIMDNDNRGFRA
ncbi:flagellar protein FliS [Natranaerovirga hydrolytica]|uniref:Flagellar protein FliS n=1 Tax=Natranaerovirga hydrolytica TaxID=680378 RepID=A0A4R1N263_9FIRM|nr:flagellar protein FliS [Natranaerovirga hydrolytica]TCL00077.1 flagellar protein FliS [Natranaerovirga hydrolytica]